MTTWLNIPCAPQRLSAAAKQEWYAHHLPYSAQHTWVPSVSYYDGRTKKRGTRDALGSLASLAETAGMDDSCPHGLWMYIVTCYKAAIKKPPSSYRKKYGPAKLI